MNCFNIIFSQSFGAKVEGQEGNNPEYRLRLVINIKGKDLFSAK